MEQRNKNLRNTKIRRNEENTGRNGKDAEITEIENRGIENFAVWITRVHNTGIIKE